MSRFVNFLKTISMYFYLFIYFWVLCGRVVKGMIFILNQNPTGLSF